jgi:LysR family transcriptional regulator, regulator for genes of the gallate degradation pathway
VGPIGVYPPVEGVEEEALATDPFCVIARTGNPLAKHRRVSLRQLKDAPWVLPSEQSAYHHQLEALFVVAGVRWPDARIATNSMTAMKAIVMNSDCVAIMPKQLIGLEHSAKLLVAVGLAESGAARSLGLSWASDRVLPASAQRFAEIIRKTAHERRFRV